MKLIILINKITLVVFTMLLAGMVAVLILLVQVVQRDQEVVMEMVSVKEL